MPFLYPELYAGDPAARPDLTACQEGDLYCTHVGAIKVYTAGAWTPASPGLADITNQTDSTKGAALVGFHLAAKVGAGRTVFAKLSETLSVKDFGAEGDGVADDTQAIQNAINAASTARAGELHFPPGTYLCTDTLRLKPHVALVGVGFTSTRREDAVCSLIFAQHGADKDACILVDKPLDNVHHARIRGLLLDCGRSGWNTILKLRESHWADIRGNYFVGTPRIAAIWMGATLYPKIEDNVFSIKGHAIDARQENYNITYYGTNWALIRGNSFFCTGSAVVATGLLHFSENNIESTATDCIAKIRFVGPASSSFTVSRNYNETRNDAAASVVHAFLKVEASSTGVIESNFVAGDNTQAGTESVCIDLSGQAFTGRVVDNTFLRWRTALRPPSASSNVEIARNRCLAVAVVMADAARAGSNASSAKGDQPAMEFNRDPNSVLRIARVDHCLPQLTRSTQGVLLRRGQVIAVDAGGMLPMEFVEDAGRFPGARVTIVAVHAFVIAHAAPAALHDVVVTAPGAGYTNAVVSIRGGGGSGAVAKAEIVHGRLEKVTLVAPGGGYQSEPTIIVTGDGHGASAAALLQASFRLAKGGLATVPAGRALDFVVDPLGRLCEVGDASARM